MKYENLYEEFLEHMGEDTASITELSKKEGVDVSDGKHVMLGVVVVKYLIDAINKKNDTIADKIFDFFEKMAKSDDVKVCEVLEFTVLEDLASQDEETIDYCKNKMRKETLESFKVIKQYANPD